MRGGERGRKEERNKCKYTNAILKKTLEKTLIDLVPFIIESPEVVLLSPEKRT
jgi:hypothetical protein